MMHLKTLLPKSSPAIDALLLPRLKFMGYLMLSFAFACFSYAMLEEEEWIVNESHVPTSLREVDPESTWQTTTLIEVENTYILSPYIAAISFTIVGFYCLFYVKQRKKTLPIKIEREDPPQE